MIRSSSSSRLLGQEARIPCAEERWSAAAEEMRAIRDGETVDFREARLTAIICASARARLINQLGDIGKSTDSVRRRLLVIYRLGDVVYSMSGQCLTQRRISGVWFHIRNEISPLRDKDNLPPSKLILELKSKSECT